MQTLRFQKTAVLPARTTFAIKVSETSLFRAEKLVLAIKVRIS